MIKISVSFPIKQDQPGCAVKSGDKLAAAHFVLLIKPKLLLQVIVIVKK
jgi:hypothetical protein